MSAAAERSLAPPGPDERLAARFRVLRVRGARRAFRLEGVFWAALDAIAGRNRRSLAGEVSARLASASGGANLSSSLRAGVAADLLDLWEAAEARAAKPEWTRVVGAMPTPAFAAAASGRVIALNPPMRAFLASRGLRTGEDALPASVEVPPGAVFAANKPSGETGAGCHATFRVGDSRARCRVRIVLAEGPSSARLILGFVDPG